jgi:hypothetical protein
MGSDLSQFDQYFAWLFAIAIVWNLIWFGRKWYLRNKRGSIFPKISPNEILFQEYTASGRSYKTWFTKLGGARNCLKLIVTPTELWVTSWFPFNLLVDEFDLEHRIPKSRITNLILAKSFLSKSFLIKFVTEAGSPRQLQIWPTNWKQFIEALDPDGKLQASTK